MQFNADTFKSILFVCAVIGVCQSIMWLVFTTCAILTFRCVFVMPKYDTDQIIWTTIVKLYFEGEECRVEGNPPGYPDISEASLTKPIEVFSFMISFLIVSCIQFISSVFLLKCRCGQKILSVLKEWCFITFLVCLMDAVLAGAFLHDYIELKELLSRNSGDEDGITAAPGAMFVVAARGFALWIINAAFVVYFSIYLFCSPSEMILGEKGEEDRKIGQDNPAFQHSSTSFVFRDGKKSDLAYPVMQHQQSVSLSSFEGVTPFNEEERSEINDGKGEETKGEKDKLVCACQKRANETVGVFNGFGRSAIYHSHGCPALRSELEEKLATMRGKEEGIIYKAKKLDDFSHNIRNFKHGGGQSQPKPVPLRGRIPEAPPLPAAAICNNSSFY